MSFRKLLLKETPKVLLSGRKNYHNVSVLTKPEKHNLKISFMSRWYAQNKQIKCWQCGIVRKNYTELFCEQCKYIQSPQDKNNYFKIFEIDEKFDIDQKQLTQKYRQLQSVLHPDKFSNKSIQEKNISEEFSSLVNKAYNVLQTPLKRAIHLLYLKGDEIQEEQKVDDPEFLMEIMELNEEVESADSEDKLIKLKRKNEEELKKISNEISTAFDCNDITKAKDLIVKMKYYNSVNLHINGLMREKGIVE